MSSASHSSPATSQAQDVISKALEEPQGETGLLLGLLLEVQAGFRYVPAETISEIAEKAGVPYTRVVSLVEFFSSLSFDPVGKYVLEVCDGTACHAVGSMQFVRKLEDLLGIKEGQTTADGLFTLRRVRCVGACSLAPIIVVDGKTCGRLKLQEIGSLLETCEP